MDYPFKFKWAFTKDVLHIHMLNDAKDEELELYGMNTKDYVLDDDSIQGYLTMMLTEGLEFCSREAMPDIRVLSGEPNYELHVFMKKFMTVADKATAKQLAIQMWGVKK